jgi:hypothetical protein
MMISSSLAAAMDGGARLTGVAAMTELEALPLLSSDVQVHYLGSIDKKGKNADWDWWLYQDAKTNEWVLCEAEGPGCLWNFVVHHAVGRSDPVYRFYVDGGTTPAFEIRHSEFGAKPPFVAPLADSFRPDVSKDARLVPLDFRIVRSFCPMPFAKSLRITSSVKLEGNTSGNTGGGWGHAIWHSYPTAEGVQPFTGREDYTRLLALWRQAGQDPKPAAGGEAQAFEATLAGGTSRVIFARQEAGSIAAIRLRMEPADRAALRRLWIRITWDGEAAPAIECPAGAFFGNEFGYHRVQTLLAGTTADGTLYSYWPMPFWHSASIELENRGAANETIRMTGSVAFKPTRVLAYPRARCGHFRASAYHPMTAKEVGRDSPVATIMGRGRVVAGLISAEQSSCEGDVRVHIDGSGSPDVQSDGSESWACYGWGFEFPPQCNPAASYDGRGNREWSMLRLLTGDGYPFRTSLRMTVEGGRGDESGTDRRSGILFWYGEPKPAMVRTDALSVGDPDSEKAHAYAAPGSSVWHLTSALEGEFDDVPLTGAGRTLAAFSEFTVKIDPQNRGVLLQRRSDQAVRGQRAAVFVDGARVPERTWLHPDRNPNFRWFDDRFLIPARCTLGKRELHLRIEPSVQDGHAHWNESTYTVWSLME